MAKNPGGAVTLLPHIEKVFTSNFNHNSGHSKVFHGFTRSLQANSRIAHQPDHDSFFPDPFQFFIHQSSYHSVLCSLATGSPQNKTAYQEFKSWLKHTYTPHFSVFCYSEYTQILQHDCYPLKDEVNVISSYMDVKESHVIHKLLFDINIYKSFLWRGPTKHEKNTLISQLIIFKNELIKLQYIPNFNWGTPTGTLEHYHSEQVVASIHKSHVTWWCQQPSSQPGVQELVSKWLLHMPDAV
jgi:hypothetical protein